MPHLSEGGENLGCLLHPVSHPVAALDEVVSHEMETAYSSHKEESCPGALPSIKDKGLLNFGTDISEWPSLSYDNDKQAPKRHSSLWSWGKRQIKTMRYRFTYYVEKKKTIKSQKIPNFDEDEDKHKSSCTAGRDIKKWYSHFGEQFGS